MELRHLRYFLATADAGTVSAAATRLHLTQPGLSRQIRALERGLGVQLFERAGGRLTPSHAGRALLPLARDLIAQADAFLLAAGYLSAGRLSRVTIAAPTVTLTDVVAPFIATLDRGDPTTDVFSADGLDPADALRRNADLVIGTVRPQTPYRSRDLATLPVWAYVPATHRWAIRGSISLTELMEEPLIGLPQHFTARQALDVAVDASGMTHGSLLEAASGTVAQALAAAGRGVAVVSDDPRFELVPLAVVVGDGMLSVRLVAVWHSEHPAAELLEELAERLRAFVRSRYAITARGTLTPAPPSGASSIDGTVGF